MPSTGKVAPWLFGEDQHAVQWLPGGTLQLFDDVLGTVSLA